ncbi:protein IMPACT-B [Clonorchis sinensis]|uniref:Protein IMPACT-B n=1 Tax=Clonorchis sinensis TaxID=79923 RepID=H2KQ59_CLOSI|nr:protein IMPACT-B [Clonorchis sinensis]
MSHFGIISKLIAFLRSVYAIRISPPSDSVCDNQSATLQFRYPPGYPTKERLVYELQIPWLRGPLFDRIRDELAEQVSAADGLPVVHSLVESVRMFLDSTPKISTDQPDCGNPKSSCEGSATCSGVAQNVVPSVQAHLNNLPSLMPVAHDSKPLELFHGDPLVDRKSVFQAHCCRAKTIGEVSRFISTLLEDRKISTATHNILAWRILTRLDGAASSVIHSDCDDDGETHAGSRLLHLLTISGVENVAVMVSRWYGGIQLGPDRFKHINNVARQLLMAHGFLGRQMPPEDSKSRKSRHKKHK